MRTLLLTLVLAVVGSAAASLVVHPFQAQDAALGAVFADRVATSLHAEVIGPAAAPALVVPLVAQDGFVNPIVFVDDPGLSGRNGAWLLRGVTGADAALTGALRAEGDELVLRLRLDSTEGQRGAALRGPRDEPGRLAERASVLVGGWLGLDVSAHGPIDMAGADGVLGRALGLVAAGLPMEALEALEQLEVEEDLSARAAELAELLRDAVAGGVGSAADDLDSLATRAVVALNLGDLAASGEAFSLLGAAGLPVGHAWAGAIGHNEGDPARALDAFDRAVEAVGYDVALAVRAAYLHAIGESERAASDLDAVAAAERPSAAGALLAAVAANLAEDPEREDVLLARLGRLAPWLTYSFERRSFLAFDADDPLGAAQALAVAIELDDGSDLYWTNFGWALYLLGFLERSEAASRRALEIDPAQYIGRYNLGLVEVVTDRLDEALLTYREALRYDPQVNPEAVADLVDAEQRYPDALGVPFALAVLEDARGERELAAAAFERYAEAVERFPDHPAADAARAREAAERASALRAPLPPIDITGAVELQLGRRGPTLDSVQPGDPLVVSFEVSTMGDALPRGLQLRASLEDAEGNVVSSAESEVDVPSGAIGFVVEVARLELPRELESGRYALSVSAEGEGLAAEAVRTVEVAGDGGLVRRLVGRDIGLLALETERALYVARDVAQSEVVIATLVRELRSAAPIAEEVLPVVDSGRFEGLSGGEVFEESSESDVLDFLAYLLAEGAADTSFTFVDGYAEWVLLGAP